MIAFACPQCRQTLQVNDALAGQRVRCPRCAQVVAVPQAAPAGVTPRPPGSSAAPAGEVLPTLPPGQETAAPARHDTHSDLRNSSQEATVPGRDGGAVPAELTDFLAPPQGPGELGRLGPYRVLKVLGHGGMGVVYEAEDPQLQRRVALKAMLPTLAASATARQRFLREARLAASLEHDHVVSIYQVGEDRGIPFLAMPFLQGEPLDERVKREGTLPAAEVLRIGRETAEGLAAAHAKGLVHRDIKPGNLWLEAKDEGRRQKAESEGLNSSFGLLPSSFKRVKILDFGLAWAGSEAGPQLTQSGAILGTPAYMAPEQATGQKADARADLFSLGCVLYRLSTGALPFQGPDTISTLLAVATEDPRPPRDVNPAVPARLSDLVMKLLAKKPEDRPTGAAAVVAAIRDLESQGPGKAPPAARVQRDRVAPPAVGRGRGRRRLGLAVAAVLLAGVGVGGYLALNSSDADTTPPDDGPVAARPDGPKAPPEPEDTRPEPGDNRPAIPVPVKVAAGAGAFDTLRAADIPAASLAAAGWVPPRTPPPELVGILGDRKAPNEAFAAVAVHPEGRVLAVLSRAGALQFWDVAARKRINNVRPVHDPTRPDLLYSRDGKLLALTASGGRVNLRSAEVTGGRLLHRFDGANGERRPMAFSPDGKLLALGRSGGQGAGLVLYATATGRAVWTLLDAPAQVSAVAFSPDNRLLAASYQGKSGALAQVKFWDATTGQALRTLLGKGLHQNRERLTRPATSLAFSPDGRWLVSTHEYCKAPFLFSMGKGRPARAFTGHQEWATGAAFTPDGRWVASCARNGEVKVWASQTRKVRQTFLLGQDKGKSKSGSPTGGPIRRVLFSPDGRHLLALHGNGLLSILRLAPAPGPDPAQK